MTTAIVLAHIHTAEILIHHMGLAQITKASTGLGFQRIKSLNSCLQALKAWFDSFLNIPSSSYIGLPFSIVSQTVRCLGLLYHLSALDEPGWSREDVQATANVIDITTRVANNMEQVRDRMYSLENHPDADITCFQVVLLAGIDNTESPDGDVFSRTAKRFRAMASKWSERLRPVDVPIPEAQMAQPDLLGIPDPLDFDWSDNSWMMDFSTMPNYYQMMPS